jgi:hypothetical protein
MHYTSYSKHAVAQGKKVLRQLLPKVKARLADLTPEQISDLILKGRTDVGRSIIPYLREDNIKAVMYRERPGGKWITDFMLDQSDGVTNVIGTPERSPLASKAEAEAWAFTTLTGVNLTGTYAWAASEPAGTA